MRKNEKEKGFSEAFASIRLYKNNHAWWHCASFRRL